jgi:hypothetical protein
MFHILQEVGAERKGIQLRPTHLAFSLKGHLGG